MSASGTELGALLQEHIASLPVSAAARGPWRYWPSALVFVGVPAIAAPGIRGSKLELFAPALLAVVGVLGGLLFQVLAWIAGRIGQVADTMEDREPTREQMALLTRLDVARANVAYASLISVCFVVCLGAATMLKSIPGWSSPAFGFALIHLGFTLVLVLVRINKIGKSDRIAALTAHAKSFRD